MKDGGAGVDNAREGRDEPDIEAYRPLLFAIAYRMLGSVMDAEDIVQEAFLSWNEREQSGIHHPKAYLCKIVTNRCVDRIRGAVREREAYVGPWLPVPLLTEDTRDNDPGAAYLRKESLSTAYLLLLQQLSWSERAVFVLREALGYEYDEIAEIVGKSSVNCRQIYRRARKAVSGLETSAEVPIPKSEKLRQTVDEFVAALTGGHPGKLIGLLKADANLYSDGGGKATAATRPILGAERVASFLFGVLAKFPSDFSYRVADVNGQPGIVTYFGDVPSSVVTLRIEAGVVAAVYIVVNPDKLGHLPARH
ncbi:RNA polymerase sigma-70 factor [Cohnella cellulosilytica]|uniref:RNA polymerase sigma-70 factor n=1 Tax=Cohnella cellulosilytica TaxID=986710 RepID=A0ABW2FM73_9BACL